MLDFGEKTEELLSVCDKQAKIWEKFTSLEFEFSQPLSSEKADVNVCTIGYVVRMSDLYHASRRLLEDDSLIPSVMLARGALETAAMICLLQMQVSNHGGSQQELISILKRHKYGIRHNFGLNNTVRPYSILTA
ncbi:MAG: hypothetical protein ACTSY1_02740, partial [Alphaproteobacteria bacterium]